MVGRIDQTDFDDGFARRALSPGTTVHLHDRQDQRAMERCGYQENSGLPGCGRRISIAHLSFIGAADVIA